ncbi:MAG TPA: ABC transporter ATP-binding protein [Nitrososphaerales archaeon]|nr:ABC transporter ATP-binding protein [Nitrososphaerales archaeon]
MSSLLKLSNVSVSYKNQVAVDSVSLEIPTTSYTLGIVGESGSGKTTLGLSIINLVEPPGRITSGKIEFMGKDVLSMSETELLSYRGEQVSMVYQSAMNALNPVKRVASHVEEVLRVHGHESKSEARDRAKELLENLGIKKSRANDYPHQLSGGMRQRVVIAMALALSPKLLIADEPTSALDVVVQRQILSLIKKQVLQKNLSLFFITHELAILGGLVEYVAVMFQGEVVEYGELRKVLFEPLHPYTEMLVNSILTLASGPDALLASPRTAAEIAKNGGCKYAGICKYAFERCRKERPKLLESEGKRLVACHKYN